MPRADLLVNATPVGMKNDAAAAESPIEDEFIPAGGIVFDLVYNPPETPLLKAAKECGATPVSGLGMLVYQGAESFRIWTGQDAPTDVMFDAARAALAD
jgi:shikimate dehydrogenase